MSGFEPRPKFGGKFNKNKKTAGGAAAQRKRKLPQSKMRFRDRGGDDWSGPIVDYKELELLRKLMSGSGKIMSRKRGGTSAREQRDIRRAIKHARFIGLLPFTGA